MAGNRVVVGAHYGLRDWLIQRVSAVVILLYVAWLLAEVGMLPVWSYGNWAGIFASVHMKVLTVLAALAVSYHGWIGVRDIFMDYVKPVGMRLLLQVVAVTALIGYVIWAAVIVWRV